MWIPLRGICVTEQSCKQSRPGKACLSSCFWSLMSKKITCLCMLRIYELIEAKGKKEWVQAWCWTFDNCDCINQCTPDILTLLRRIWRTCCYMELQCMCYVKPISSCLLSKIPSSITCVFHGEKLLPWYIYSFSEQWTLLLLFPISEISWIKITLFKLIKLAQYARLSLHFTLLAGWCQRWCWGRGDLTFWRKRTWQGFPGLPFKYVCLSTCTPTLHQCRCITFLVLLFFDVRYGFFSDDFCFSTFTG